MIVPFLVSGFGVFMMRQYADQAVPDELIEAARVDGCTTFRIYWNVVLPALRPAAAVLGLLTFMEHWNEFLWPYVGARDPDNPTVQLSLRRFSRATTTTRRRSSPERDRHPAAVLVFVLFGRQIIGGIMEGAVKA